MTSSLGSLRAAWWRWRTRWFTELALGATARRVETVRGGDRPALEPEQMAVVALMRDAGGHVDSFVKHYRALGATRIVLLDNGSEDDSVDRALAYDGVAVLRCTLPFRWFRAAMRRYLVETYGAGGWALLVDIDELWDYPCSDQLPLDAFLRYLNQHGFTAAAAQMLDLFPTGAIDGWPEPGDALQQEAVWFDLSGLRESGLAAEMPRNDYPTTGLRCFRGGVRLTAFGAEPLLTKLSLTRRTPDGGGPLVENAHFVSGARIADVSTVLRHYKFDALFRQRADEAVRRKQYYGGSVEYRRYRMALLAHPSLRLEGETSVRYSSPNQLLEAGFLQAAIRYRDAAAAHGNEPGSTSAGPAPAGV